MLKLLLIKIIFSIRVRDIVWPTHDHPEPCTRTALLGRRAEEHDNDVCSILYSTVFFSSILPVHRNIQFVNILRLHVYLVVLLL